jgi:hypothetical protein
MGFPFEEASWSAVDGAMFIGWGSSMPGIFTLLAAAICTWVLLQGNISEHKRFAAFEK